jgi:hypothetical protein
MAVTVAAAMVVVLIGGGNVGKTINKEDGGNGMRAVMKQCQERDGSW